jgi:uncharacterized protein (TIGR02453 family)
MAAPSAFQGFPRESVAFYTQLASNNNKEWFQEHKSEFDRFVMEPARDFVADMGNLLREISPGIVADPRLDRSIFRHYRDTRFSKDKSPYKTHLGIFFWEGNRVKMDCPGYYFHLEPPIILVAAGNHCFSKPVLEQYRDSVVDPQQGPALKRAVEAVKSKGIYEVGEKHYKKTPRGYDPNHENAEFLLFNGLTAYVTARIPEELYSSAILDYCFERFRDMQPIHAWLLDMIRSMAK